MTEFTERYKTLSNFELLKILEEKENYKPIAVETAKTEINKRQLSEQELEKIKSKISNLQIKKNKKKEKKKEQEEKLKNYGTTFFETISPIQNGIQTPERIIRLITIVFGGISIYHLYKEFGMLRYIFTDSKGGWDLSMVEYFFPLIILPIATYLFWKRKKIGWILLAIFLTYSAMSSLVMFFMNLGRQPSGFANLDALFPTVSPIAYLATLVFFGGSLWAISKIEIRDIYDLNKTTLFKVIGLTIIVNGIFIITIFL
jgi:hypothetical protein